MNHLNKRKLFIVLIYLLSFQTFAQDTSQYEIKLNKKYFKSFLPNTKEVLIAPFRMNEKSLITAGGILCMTGGMMMADKDAQQLFQRNRTLLLDDISRYGIEPWGRGLYTAPVIGIFYLHGKMTRNNRSERVALLSAQSALITSGIIQVPKYLFQRQRPFQNTPANPFIFEGPLGNYTSNSMASGHTALAFSVASMISMEYREKKWVAILAYSIAALTGISRIYDNKHWTSDVILGAAMGTGISRIIYYNFKKRKFN